MLIWKYNETVDVKIMNDCLVSFFIIFTISAFVSFSRFMWVKRTEESEIVLKIKRKTYARDIKHFLLIDSVYAFILGHSTVVCWLTKLGN